MAEDPKDDRVPLAKSMDLATKVVTLSVSLALPLALGVWGDSYFGWSPLLTIGGFILGFLAAGYQLYELIKTSDAETQIDRSKLVNVSSDDEFDEADKKWRDEGERGSDDEEK